MVYLPLWISDNQELPELQQLSLKSMILTGHNVTLYTYGELNNVPDGINLADGNKILDKSKIFKYKEGFNKGSYAGFADWFRVKCLYETGTAWFDCDILAIKNINNINLNNIIISSEYNPNIGVHPSNTFLKFKKKDKLLKAMLEYMEKVKDNVKHGDTGPKLVKSLMDDQYEDYYNYLANPNFIAAINYFDHKDFLKPSEDIVGNLNFDEIWGFHIWNALFKHHMINLDEVNNGFYFDLKEAILTSSTKEEYGEKIRDIITLNHNNP